ncbi:ferritin-like domain-containing protein [Blastococcus brunescens]|uniref:Ferritin-like domain-containing protein n=1 Tax=Blastococcus brunescens TaxID=1564165 RepID=A0ABZ1AVD6_9ACTN|nr:ferritin-like domain-containing protein [Blastococcus sp. BMG 8361]WRL62517.1 ferritin-like domain-containing protein [Blastococcus sp. BMG 8361]
MADEAADPGALNLRTENAALAEALAAEHAAIWGYGVVGAALAAEAQGLATASEVAHRDARDRVLTLLAERDTEPVGAEGGYSLPFPVLSATDAAALAVVLEDGVAAAWVRVLDQSVERTTRELAVGILSATEVRAVGWRGAAGQTPVTRPFPGLPAT